MKTARHPCRVCDREIQARFWLSFLLLLFSFLNFRFMFVIYFRIVALNLEIMLNVFDLYFGLKVLSICWVFY